MNTQTLHKTDAGQIVRLSQTIAQEILAYIEDLNDEGPRYEGWQSKKLCHCIGILQDAINHARSRPHRKRKDALTIACT